MKTNIYHEERWSTRRRCHVHLRQIVSTKVHALFLLLLLLLSVSSIHGQSVVHSCGRNWTDAANNCHKPCPTGDDAECTDLNDNNEAQQYSCHFYTYCNFDDDLDDDDPSPAPSRSLNQVLYTGSREDLQLGGQTTTSYGYVFNIRTKPNNDGVVLLTGFDFYTESTSDVNFELWTRLGTFKGHLGTYNGWDLIAAGTVQGRGIGRYTAIPEEVFTPVAIPGGGGEDGTRAFYLTLESINLVYKLGTVLDGDSGGSDERPHAETEDIAIYQGEGVLSYPFPDPSGVLFYRSPREYLGAIYYNQLSCAPLSFDGFVNELPCPLVPTNDTSAPPTVEDVGSSTEEEFEWIYAIINEKYKPILLDQSHGWEGGTYSEAIDFCGSFGGRNICPYEATCPLGPGSAPNLEGIQISITNEAWVPIINIANEWVQVGPADSCTLYISPHSGLFGTKGKLEEDITSPAIMCCEEVATETLEIPMLRDAATLAETYYCGANWNSVNFDCISATPCPSMSSADCHGDEQCIPFTNCGGTFAFVSNPAVEGGGPDPEEVRSTFFCGTNAQFLYGQCASATPCPDGPEDCDGIGEGCVAFTGCNEQVDPSTFVGFASDTFFCAASWEDLDSKCVDGVPQGATPCPTGDILDCEDGQGCFAFACGSRPPSDSVLLQEQPALVPSNTVDQLRLTFYCGTSIEQIDEDCENAIPCPSGDECPEGTGCLAFSQCGGIDIDSLDLSFDDDLFGQGIGTDDTIISPAALVDALLGSLANQAINQPTQLFPVAPTSPTVSPAPTTNRNYCGVSQEEAQERCAITIPCPDGLNSTCLYGQACFRITGPCDATSDGIASGYTPVTNPSTAPMWKTPSPTDPPTDSPSEPHAYDPNAIDFCGTDYWDARDNCHKNKVCPGGDEECPSGQRCFPGMDKCTTSSPTMSVAPTDRVTTDNPTASPTVALPTTSPTDSPTDSADFDIFNGGCNQLLFSGVFLPGLVMGGVILVALISCLL